MFLTQREPERGRSSGNTGAGITYTTTPTTLASQGGLLINIDSATGDIASTTDGWIEDEKYGWYFDVIANGCSAEFDTNVTRTGAKTLKLSTTNVTGRAWVSIRPSSATRIPTIDEINKYLYPVKPSTKYRFRCFVKLDNVTSTFITVTEYSSSSTAATATGNTNADVGTKEWVLFERLFTTNASSNFIDIIAKLNTAGNISSIWIDVNSMTLEEVVEPVANSLQATNKTASIQSFTAVGSTDNIDQSLDPTFVAANTYTPPVAISETATNKQTFVPTKSKMTRIGVYPVAKGTGNWTVTVHDASNVVQASITIANASLTNGAVNYFNVPCNLTALASYHFHVTSTVADGTVRVATASDLETVSYIQNYYKPTTNFKASQNNQSISISADEDGFLDGGVFNLLTGTYTYTATAIVGQSIVPNLVTATNASGTSSFAYIVSTDQVIKGGSASGVHVMTFKETLPGATSITVKGTLRYSSVEYSYDNSSWTMLQDERANASFVPFTHSITPSGVDIFIRFTTTAGGVNAFFGYTTNPFQILATIDTSSLSTLYNYPTNKNVTEYYTTSLGSPTTSATYRATKWGFPAIEYSATEYQFLNIDTTATGSVVQFSEAGAIFTTVADGASLAISSTSNPLLWVRTNITANRLYLSSNCYNSSSSKDGSLKQTTIYQVVQP